MVEFFDLFHPHIVDVSRTELRGRQALGKPAKGLRFLYVSDGHGHLELDGARHPLSAGCVVQIPMHRQVALVHAAPSPLCYYTVQYDYKLIPWEDGAGITGAEGAAGNMANGSMASNTANASDASYTVNASNTSKVSNASSVSDATNVSNAADPDMAASSGSASEGEKRLPFDLVVPMMDQAGMRAEMMSLHSIWTQKKQGFSGAAKLMFFHIIHRVYEQQQNSRKEEDTTERTILECVRYIDNNYTQTLEREKLARQVAVSSSYFSVLFKKYVGCSPVQYIMRVRLDKAMKLLRESSKPVSVVAFEVGFRDPLYFTRVFSREVGVTPREYREVT